MRRAIVVSAAYVMSLMGILWGGGANSADMVNLGAAERKRLEVREVYHASVRRLSPWKKVELKSVESRSSLAEQPEKVIASYLKYMVSGEIRKALEHADQKATKELESRGKTQLQQEQNALAGWFDRGALWITHVIEIGESTAFVVSSRGGNGGKGVKLPIFLKRKANGWVITQPPNAELYSALFNAFPYEDSQVLHQSSTGGARTSPP